MGDYLPTFQSSRIRELLSKIKQLEVSLTFYEIQDINGKISLEQLTNTNINNNYLDRRRESKL